VSLIHAEGATTLALEETVLVIEDKEDEGGSGQDNPDF
jgi:hypothetical protein